MEDNTNDLAQTPRRCRRSRGRLILNTVDGIIWKEATGTELLKEWSEKKQEMTELAYGDPSSSAESMAFRRAAAKFGLGLYLYDKD